MELTAFHCVKYASRIMPCASTCGLLGEMLISCVGFTCTMGASAGYPCGNQMCTGMLYSCPTAMRPTNISHWWGMQLHEIKSRNESAMSERRKKGPAVRGNKVYWPNDRWQVSACVEAVVVELPEAGEESHKNWVKHWTLSYFLLDIEGKLQEWRQNFKNWANFYIFKFLKNLET